MSKEQPPPQALSFPTGPAPQVGRKPMPQDMRRDSRQNSRRLEPALEDRACMGSAFHFLFFSKPAPVLGTRHLFQSPCGMKSRVRLSVQTSLPSGGASSETSRSGLLAHTSLSHLHGLFLELSQRVYICLELGFLAVTVLPRPLPH